MSVDYKSIFSYQGGIGVGIQFAGRWGLMTGLKFNQKGGRVTIETRDPNNPLGIIQDGNIVTDVGEITVTTKHNWLSIPILARAEFGENLKFGLAIGPQINLGIGEYRETVEYSLENLNVNDDENTYGFGESTTDLIKKSHVSLLILPYVAYDLNKNSSLRFSLMFERGSDMINENYQVPTTDGGVRRVDGTLKNNQMGIMLSYEYRFDLNIGTKY
jgi:hypothetical protein